MKRHIPTRCTAWWIALGALAASVVASPVVAADRQQQTQVAPANVAATAQTKSPTAARPVPAELSSAPAQLGPGMSLYAGKSTLLRLQDPIDRVSVGNPGVADVTVISQREVYLLGKALGTTNVIIWAKGGQATVIDVTVNADLTPLESELRMLLPDEKDIKVTSASGSIVLRGTVADAVKADQAVALAEAWRARLTRDLVLPVQAGGAGATTVSIGGGQGIRDSVAAAGPQIINLLKVRDPQQVMLEVKVAEVSKTLLERVGVTLAQQATSGGTTFTFLSQSNFLNQLLGAAAITRANPFDALQLDAQKDDGVVKMLAEPNIMAISGQEASFRAGGKIFIPVARENNLTGGTTITLEEKEFGVGVKFKPTVLEGGRINLKVAPEVSELNSTGSPFTTIGGVTSVIPSFTVRRAETTVQLNDGQSFMVAGLVKNDVATTVNRFPGLGEVPILGTLFRSSEFQKDKTELMFVITPRLVKPLPPNYALPTDYYNQPSRAEYFLEGKMEGDAPATKPSSSAPAGKAGGFDSK
jgi:pilus assembly protein CpaC